MRFISLIFQGFIIFGIIKNDIWVSIVFTTLLSVLNNVVIYKLIEQLNNERRVR